MKNRDQWQPSKYVREKGRLRASRDPKEVGVASRLIADLTAAAYEENLPRYSRGRLLDLGCGKVPLFLAYRDHVSDNVCVDWENTLHDDRYLDFACDLTQVLPFGDGEFDTILLSDVLEHVPQPERLWQEVARILSEGGRLVMNVPFYYGLHEQPHDYYRYTEFALRRFAEQSGLRLLQLEPLGGAPEILADLFAKNALRVPKIGRAAAAFAQWLTARFLATRFGRKVSEATREDFPFAYFLVAEKPRSGAGLVGESRAG
jgi:SAM-dependent methyltransferase